MIREKMVVIGSVVFLIVEVHTCRDYINITFVECP